MKPADFPMAIFNLSTVIVLRFILSYHKYDNMKSALLGAVKANLGHDHRDI